jgi:hypothetical protein
VSLNEKSVSHDRPKSAQGRNKTELPKFFAKIEIKFDATKMFLLVQRRQVVLNRQFEGAKRNQNRQHDKKPYHNSFP